MQGLLAPHHSSENNQSTHFDCGGQACIMRIYHVDTIALEDLAVNKAQESKTSLYL